MSKIILLSTEYRNHEQIKNVDSSQQKNFYVHVYY